MIIDVLPEWRVRADRYNYSIEQLRTPDATKVQTKSTDPKWIGLDQHYPNIKQATARIIELASLDGDCDIAEYADRVESIYNKVKSL